MFGTALVSVFGGVFSWLSSPIINTIGANLLKAYQTKLDAEKSVESQTAGLAARSMDLDAREADIQGKLLIVEQGNLFTRWVRPMWAAPFVLWTWKVIVWDNMLGSWTHGNTDPLGSWTASLGMIIVVAYFGGRTYEMGQRIKALRSGLTGKP